MVANDPYRGGFARLIWQSPARRGPYLANAGIDSALGLIYAGEGIRAAEKAAPEAWGLGRYVRSLVYGAGHVVARELMEVTPVINAIPRTVRNISLAAATTYTAGLSTARQAMESKPELRSKVGKNLLNASARSGLMEGVVEGVRHLFRTV